MLFTIFLLSHSHEDSESHAYTEHAPFVRITHREVILHSDQRRIAPEKLRTQRMKRTHLDPADGLIAQKTCHTLLHLVGSFVRKCDCAYTLGGQLMVGYQVHDPGGENLGLAAPWSGENLKGNVGWMPNSYKAVRLTYNGARIPKYL